MAVHGTTIYVAFDEAGQRQSAWYATPEEEPSALTKDFLARHPGSRLRQVPYSMFNDLWRHPHANRIETWPDGWVAEDFNV